ncbi:MAG: hypothetical protein ACLUER_00545 [Odoribacter splanchnicus]
MQEIVMGMLPGMPVAAVLFYLIVTGNRDHAKEREQWRATIESRDNRFVEQQKVTNQLITEVKKLTYIIENYVINKGKNPDGK